MQYDAHQLQAINSDADKLLCLAGAGTGKTTSMIARICKLVDDGTDPASILVLTFTNAAAFEMKDRYLKNHAEARCPEFRTFHSFCYRLISTDKSVREAIGYSKVPSVADENDCKRIETKASLQTGIPNLSRKRKAETCKTLKGAHDQNILRKAQYRIMCQENLITFDYLCNSVCGLFIKNHPSIIKYKDQFKYVFVDEFQDTDEIQWEFVSSFSDSKLFVVGDALQAIYGFRGADSSIIQNLSTDDSWTVVKLIDNHRSTESICRYANEISASVPEDYRVAINSSVVGPAVRELTYYSENNCVDEAAIASVITCIRESKNSSNHAILFRTNQEVSSACNMLVDKHIDHTCNKPDNDAIHILKSVTSNKYALDWLSTSLNADKYTEWIKISSVLMSENSDADSKSTSFKLFSLFKETYGYIPAINQRLLKIQSIRRILKTEGLSDQDRYSKISEVIGVELTELNTDVKTVKELCDQLISRLEHMEESQVYVGTIHSVKGLEFDNVYLMNIGGRTFPLNTQENKNLFYVGVTRAKNILNIYYGD